MKNEKPLEILVVEDNTQFTAAAKSVYDKQDSGVHTSYALTYEEAMAYLQSSRVDGVITDLFFPSETNWADKFLPEIRKESLKKMVEKGELPNILSWSYERLSNYDKNLVVGFDLNAQRDITVKDYRDVSENPSGLGIGLHCLQEKIPFIMISQGSRHGGNLGLIRYALQYCNTFKRMLNNTNDPLPEMLLYQGVAPSRNPKIDKGLEITWKDAMYGEWSGLLEKLKRD
mgnify:CR=1 FL=1